MNRSSLVFFNFSLFLFAMLIFAVTQSTVFGLALHWRPSFQMAVLVLVYIALYRKPTEGIFFTLLGSYMMGFMSSMFTSIAVLTGLMLFFSIRAFKARVYTSGAAYFTWVGVGSVILFHLLNFLAASLFEMNPPSKFPFLSWMLEALLTSFVVRPCYHLFVWIDAKTGRDAEVELAG